MPAPRQSKHAGFRNCARAVVAHEILDCAEVFVARYGVALAAIDGPVHGERRAAGATREATRADFFTVRESAGSAINTMVEDWRFGPDSHAIAWIGDDPRLHFNTGAAAFQSGRLDEAARQFNSSLATPDLPLQERAYYNLGNTQFRLGEKSSDPKKKQENWEQALAHYESAIQLAPKDEDAVFNRDLVKKKLEELKQQQKKDDKNDKSDKQDKSDQSKGDDQKKDDQKKPDDKSDQQKKDKPEDQKQDTKKPDQPDPNSKENDSPPSEAGGKVMPMTPQQAQQLLDAQKNEEKVMVFLPPSKTNRTSKVFKDW